MCGRMDIDEGPIKDWARHTLNIELDLQTNHDLRPTQTIAAIGGDRHQVNATWGIQPAWAKKLLINAQGETVAEKKTFKRAFAERRCVVPCSGWYEWRDEASSRKQKYHFAAANGSPLLMAGILFTADEGLQLVTLTIHPNAECEPYHNRMPLFVAPEHLGQWLTGSTEDAIQLVAPLSDGTVSIQPASV